MLLRALHASVKQLLIATTALPTLAEISLALVSATMAGLVLLTALYTMEPAIRYAQVAQAQPRQIAYSASFTPIATLKESVFAIATTMTVNTVQIISEHAIRLA